jgi:hypothetical protein
MARRALTITDQDKAEMRRLYVAENKGIVEIGKQFSISASTVSRFLKVQGTVLRKRGTRTNKNVDTTTSPFESHMPETTEVETPTFSM